MKVRTHLLFGILQAEHCSSHPWGASKTGPLVPQKENWTGGGWTIVESDSAAGQCRRALTQTIQSGLREENFHARGARTEGPGDLASSTCKLTSVTLGPYNYLDKIAKTARLGASQESRVPVLSYNLTAQLVENEAVRVVVAATVATSAFEWTPDVLGRALVCHQTGNTLEKEQCL